VTAASIAVESTEQSGERIVREREDEDGMHAADNWAKGVPQEPGPPEYRRPHGAELRIVDTASNRHTGEVRKEELSERSKHSLGPCRADAVMLRLAVALKTEEARLSRAIIGEQLRAICLALPEAREEAMKRGPSYRIGDRIFALERPRNQSIALWCKVPEGTREFIIAASPARFFVPPYFGAKGWIGLCLDPAADWREVQAFVRRSYRMTAPKRLVTEDVAAGFSRGVFA